MTIVNLPSVTNHYTQFARMIREVRGEHKQEWIAAKVGYSRRQWIRWEAGQAVPSFRAMLQLRKHFPNINVPL